MTYSLTRGRTVNPTGIGIGRDALPPIGFRPKDSRFDFRVWWPEARRHLPVEAEIGPGKGAFLVQQASRVQEVNHLGIESAHAYWLYTADRCRRHGLDHVRVAHADAATFIRWHTPEAMLQQVHCYFPDPWPKKKHHKRRLIQAAFLRELHRVLVAGGRCRIVTDHDGYFAWIRDHLEEVRDLFEEVPFDQPISAGSGEIVGTNFERKYRPAGRPFHAVALRKRQT